MKKFTFKGVLDGFRSSVNQGAAGQGGPGGQAGQGKEREGTIPDIVENLRTDHFNVTKTFCHGFPYQPTAMAFDPIQRLLAIGTKSGCLRILGRPGVDIHAKHDQECSAVLHLQFLANEGSIISATADDTLHLWNFRSTKKPEVVHKLKFQRERITCLTLPFQSKWAYVGTERGNIHVVNTETFQLSGYIINWNKAIEITRKTHPGSVMYLGDNPSDPNKLLIGFDSGQLVLWDLKCKAPEARYQSLEPLRSVSWHSDGKQFMCSHSDGSLTTWNTRVFNKPVGLTFPHSRSTKDGKPEPCKSIQKVEWKSSRTGENFVIFSGGLTADRAGRTPSLTVIHGKTTTVLEMEHNVLDFIVMCESQWESEVQDPYAIVVLLQQDLVVIDLLTPGYPCFENPYPMDIHESPVTCCTYLANAPGDLIPAFYSVGAKGIKKTGFSEREWPVDGGQWGSTSCSYAEIILTGHADGSVKFWDASSTNLQVLYKLKTSKPFERPKSRRSTESSSTADDDPFAVQYLALCPESRLLAVAGASCQVLLFRFRKQETVMETAVLEIPIIYEVEDPTDYFTNTGNFDFAKTGDAKPSADYFIPIRVKSGPQKKPPGYQADLVCLTPWVNGEPPGGISALALNSFYGLLSYGNESGLVIVDIIQKTCLLNMGTPDLYGTADPYQRAPKSPKRLEIYDEKSPTDQVSFSTSELETPNNTPKSPIPPDVSDSPQLLPEPDQPEDDDQYDQDYGTLRKQSITGSLSKLTESLAVEEKEIPKCRSTTPPTNARSRSQTWSQMKGIVKNLRKDSTLRQTLSYPATPVPGAAAVETGNVKAAASSVTVCGAVGGGSDLVIDSSIIGDGDFSFSSASSTPRSSPSPPPLSRPTNLPLNLGSGGECVGGGSTSVGPTSNAPVPPPRVKKKKSLLNFNKKPPKCVDLRKNSKQPGTLSNMMKKIHKLDNTFSRSRSSSMSSLDNITSEAIQCLTFVESYSRKGESTAWPNLWVGTSLGSILIITISLPNGTEARKCDPAMASPSGTIFRLKGSILSLSFLDYGGAILPGTFETWRDETKEQRSKTPTKGMSSGSRQSPTQLSLDSGGSSGGDRQLAVLVSEKQSRILALPSQTCLYKQQLADASFVVKAELTSIKVNKTTESACMLCYVSTGRLHIYSLPSLRPLVDVDFVPLADLSFHQTRKAGIVDPMLSIWGQQLFVNEDTNSIAKTFCLSSFGHGMYLSSPSEMQKFSISSDFHHIMNSMFGDLYLECEMPEKPKEGFFTGLFGGGVRNLDREELFGETSGKASRSVAKHIPGSGSPALSHLEMRSNTVSGDIARTRMLMVERGEKLGRLGDTTEKMMNESENFSNAAHQLMLKYKDKKWYQL